MDSHSLKQRIKEMAVFLSRLELCELEIQFLAFENALGKGKDGYSRLSMLDCFAGFWDKVSSCLLDGYRPPVHRWNWNRDTHTRAIFPLWWL